MMKVSLKKKGGKASVLPRKPPQKKKKASPPKNKVPSKNKSPLPCKAWDRTDNKRKTSVMCPHYDVQCDKMEDDVDGDGIAKSVKNDGSIDKDKVKPPKKKDKKWLGDTALNKSIGSKNINFSKPKFIELTSYNNSNYELVIDVASPDFKPETTVFKTLKKDCCGRNLEVTPDVKTWWTFTFQKPLWSTL